MRQIAQEDGDESMADADEEAEEEEEEEEDDDDGRSPSGHHTAQGCRPL